MSGVKMLGGACNPLTIALIAAERTGNPSRPASARGRPTKKTLSRGRREPRTYSFCLNPEYDEEGSGP